jgi:galactose mutarotase-like enzyme
MKEYSIQNDLFQISVKEIGAELCSIKSLKTHTEYVWQAAPEVWAAHAPNLFPVIGCLKGNGFLYKGKEYQCPKHGFVRKNENIRLLEKTGDSLSFGLTYNDDLLKIYPFKFKFTIRFILKENRVQIVHEIINQDEELMLFSLGGHPAFTCPFNENESYTDYFLEFEHIENSRTWQVQKDGLIAKETLPALTNTNIMDLHPHLFDNDALVFKDLRSRKVSLQSRKSPQVLSLEFKDFPYLGIWAKPNADYVCIEPWLGIADSVDSDRDFEHKEGLISLSPKEKFTAKYSIIVTE